MKLRYSFFLLVWAFSAQATLHSDIYALLHKIDLDHSMGIYVADAKAGKPIYTYHANQFYTPASVLKIFTDAMALDVLGPGFKFKTQLWRQGKTNTVILKFSGDPTLVLEDLVEMFKQLAEAKVPMDTLIIDTTDPYPLESPPDNWMIDDQDFCWGIAAVPMIVNRNALRFSLWAKEVGQKPEITVNPGHFVQIEGAPSVQKKCAVKDGFRRKHILSMYPALELKPSCMEPTPQPIKLCIPILGGQLRSYIKDMVMRAMEQAQIKVSHKIVITFKPVSSYKQSGLIVEHASEDLMSILKQAMADSDNLVMDSLLLHILKRIAPDIQEWKDIGGVVQRWAKERFGADLKHAVITEGAGMSHANLLTPAQIGGFLSRIYQDKKFHDLFVQTLSAPQAEGTLQARMKTLASQVKAKTGTLRRRILGLAGYLTTKSGYVLSFSFMADNNFFHDGIADTRQVHFELEEAILERLAKL